MISETVEFRKLLELFKLDILKIFQVKNPNYNQISEIVKFLNFAYFQN